jgi:hypothetical protein
MKPYGAFFYLTFMASDAQHAETVAAAIVTTHNPDGEAHMQPGTLLPAEEPEEAERLTLDEIVEEWGM